MTGMNNALPAEFSEILGVVSPGDLAASDHNSAWIDSGKWDQMEALIVTGTLGAAATVDAKLEQAQDSIGTGAKDIAGKAITQLVKASNDDNQAKIELRAQELDINNGFNFVRLQITIGAAASGVCGVLKGYGPRYLPEDDRPASVVEVVN